jgi:hypothetical protein
MISDRMAAVLTRLHLGRHTDLAASCAHALGVPGVSLSLAVDAQEGPELIWCCGDASARVEDLQFTLGEGPSPDSARSGSPVSTADLEALDPDRWPALRAAITEADLPVRGLFCFPLRLGAIHVGVLSLLDPRPGALLERQTEDALTLASALTAWYLGGDGTDLRPGPDPPGTDDRAAPSADLNRAEVHQATGMVSVQLGVPLAQALLRLRAHAYATSAPLNRVAADVVGRRLRFAPETDNPSEPDVHKG